MSSEARGLRDIAAELVLVAAGGRAILLQLAHPAVGHGVADHSDFQWRPLDRLAGTLMFSYTIAYGTQAEIAYVRRRVNRAHAPVRSPGTAHQVAYNAYDPALQLWITATLYETAAMMHQRVFGRLDDESADRVYREFAVVGTALQLPPQLWPADRQAFEEYWRAQESTLAVDEATRSVAHDLLYPRHGPWWFRVVMPVARLVTTGLLSESLRTQFDLPWNAAAQRRFDLLMRSTIVVFPRLPPGLRHSLAIHYLRRLRREMRASENVRTSERSTLRVFRSERS